MTDQDKQIKIEDLASVPGGEALTQEEMGAVSGGAISVSPLGATSIKLDSMQAIKIDGATAIKLDNTAWKL